MSDQIVTVVAGVRARPGMEEKVRQELLKLLVPTRQEKGCINYDLHQAAEDQALFLFHENWSSEADLKNHLASPHIKEALEQTEHLLSEPIELTIWKRIG